MVRHAWAMLRRSLKHDPGAECAARWPLEIIAVHGRDSCCIFHWIGPDISCHLCKLCPKMGYTFKSLDYQFVLSDLSDSYANLIWGGGGLPGQWVSPSR